MSSGLLDLLTSRAHRAHRARRDRARSARATKIRHSHRIARRPIFDTTFILQEKKHKHEEDLIYTKGYILSVYPLEQYQILNLFMHYIDFVI